MKNAERFLNAYSKIENYLRLTYNHEKEEGFSSVISKVSSKNSIVKRYQADLKQYHDLRNAIVHNRSDGQVIANPYKKVVEHIEKIASSLVDPPKVHPKFGNEVATLSSDQFISNAVKLMFENSFSQVPIINNEGEFIELLTANTISRWLGDNIKVGIVSLEETKISTVLSYKEAIESHKFVKKHATLADVLDIFELNEKEGKQLNAVLITENGKKSEKLIGIITHYDLPEIYRHI